MIASEKNRQDALPVIGLNSFDWYLIAIATFLALLAAYYVAFYRGDYARLSDGREPIATILSTSNSVKTKIAGLLIWEKAVDATQLADQDQIFTDQGSAALVELDGAGKIDISENSLVVVQSGNSGSSLDVLQGTVLVTLTDASKALTVKVRNSTTRLATKDARVQFRAENGKTSIIVVGGSASLAGSGDAVSIGKNQIASVNSDGSIGLIEDLPVALIEPTHMKTIPAANGESRIVFKWETRVNSGTSRLEISRDDQFSELVHSAEVSNSEYDLKGLAYGIYFWRVGGKTSSGGDRFGEIREFEVVESLPPKLLTPTEKRNFQLTVFGQKQKKTSATVVFEWSSNLRNSGYVVDIFRDSAEKENLIKSTSTRDMALRYDLPAGSYVWRVTADTDLENGSRLGTFSVDADPKLETVPQLEAPLLDDQYDIDLDKEEGGFIRPILDFLEPTAYAAEADDDPRKFVRWKPVQGAASYQVDIASDNAFTEIFISEKVDEPRLRWPRKASGKYYMRVYAIDGNGTKGSPSNVAVVHARQPETIAPPEPLLAPVTVSPDENEIIRPSNQGLARVKFVWDSSSKQSTYELQVAKDTAFKNLVVFRDKITDTSVFTIIGPGKYFHRIRSAREDKKGPFSEPSAFVVLRVPPVITAPGPGSQVKLKKHNQNTAIRWRSSPSKADKFLLEVSKDGRFKSDVVRFNNTKPALDVDLPNGTYFARVRLAGSQSNSSDFSQPIKFSVERPSLAPVVVKKRPPRQWRTLAPFIYAGYYPATVEYQLDRGLINKSFTGEYATSYKVALGMDIGATQTEASYRFRETTFIGSEKVGETYNDLEATKRHEEFAVIFRRKFGTPDTAIVWMPEIGYSKRQIELFNINADNALSFQTVTTRGLMAGLNSIIYITDALTASVAANYTSLSKFSPSENSEGISNEIVGNSKTVGGQVGLNWNYSGSISLLPALNFEQITYSLENNVDRDNTDIKITELGVFVGGGYSF